MNTFTPFRLRIPAVLFDEMLAHARAEAPAECCGLLAGRLLAGEAVGAVTHRYPLVNELHSPKEFVSEAKSMHRAMKDMEARAVDVLAVYHSHPGAAPVPSRRDLEWNYSPRVVNLIIGLAGAEPDVRGWWLTETDYREAEWVVEG